MTEASSRSFTLDCLRGCACAMVLVYHLNFDHPIGMGQAAMEMFFALSGYMIMRSLVSSVERKGTAGAAHFALRRLRRLLPAMLGFVFGTLSLHLTLPDFSVLRFLRAALCALIGGYNFLQVYAEPGFIGFGHIWSLSLEEQFYLMAVVFILLAYALGWSRRACLLIFGTVLVATGGVSRLGADAGWYPGDSTAQVILPPLRLWSFGLGVYSAALAESAWWRRILTAAPWKVAFAAVAAIGGIAFLVGSVDTYNARTFVRQWAAVPVLVALLILLAPRLDELGFALSRISHPVIQRLLQLPTLMARTLRLVGLASYSIYLWHALVIAIFVRHQLHQTPYAWSAMFALGIGAGLLSWFFIERRFYSFTSTGTGAGVSATR